MFDQLTETQKENLLKTIVVLALQSNDKVDLVDGFVKYGAEAFDMMVETEISKDVVTFSKKRG